MAASPWKVRLRLCPDASLRELYQGVHFSCIDADGGAWSSYYPRLKQSDVKREPSVKCCTDFGGYGAGPCTVLAFPLQPDFRGPCFLLPLCSAHFTDLSGSFFPCRLDFVFLDSRLPLWISDAAAVCPRQQSGCAIL